MIDIANECLEYMASQVVSGTTPVHGQVYDTSADALAGHALCRWEPCPDETKSDCHDPAQLFAALPEYSTPAAPVAANSAVEPLVWNTLKSDFSSCRLPYSQALDVSRTYLRHFGSCRFEEMRTFRKCITEFVLDPVNEPAGLRRLSVWRSRCGSTLLESISASRRRSTRCCSPARRLRSAASRSTTLRRRRPPHGRER